MTVAWNRTTAIAQIESCAFKCEGGPLKNNTAYQWLVEQVPEDKVRELAEVHATKVFGARHSGDWLQCVEDFIEGYEACS